MKKKDILLTFIFVGCLSLFLPSCKGDEFNLSKISSELNPFMPKGGKILFTACPSNTYDCKDYIMNPDGSNTVKISIDTDVIFAEASSPRGDKIAVLSGTFLTKTLSLTFFDQAGKSTSISFDNIWGASNELLQWSPDGNKILFVGSGDIFVINSDGSGLINLTGAVDPDSIHPINHDPQWSPDGKKIAYVSSYSDGSKIFLMDSDGENKKLIIDVPETVTVAGNIQLRVFSDSPTFSPDGHKIAFVSNYSTGYDGLFTVNLDNQEITPIDVRENGYSSNNIYFADWSPTSDQVMVGVYSVNPGKQIIYLVNTNDNSLIKVIEDERLELQDSPTVLWSPNGEWIGLLMRGDTTTDKSIYIIRRNGKDLRLFLNLPNSNILRFSWTSTSP